MWFAGAAWWTLFAAALIFFGAVCVFHYLDTKDNNHEADDRVSEYLDTLKRLHGHGDKR